MAEKIYSIYSDAELMDPRLVVEIGERYVVLLAGSDGKVSALEYFTTEDNLEETLDSISQHSSLVKKNYSETKIFYNLDESVLVPVGHFNTGVAAEFLDLAFGNRAATRVNVENINVSPGIINVYRSNDNWQEIIEKNFRVVTKRHLYSRLAELSVQHNDAVRLIFYPGSFIIIATKQKQPRIIRGFEITGDADVLYHLLNVCKQADVDLHEHSVGISGVIEADASLIQLLNGYCQLRFETPSAGVLPADAATQYPAHYFTSTINLLP